LDATSRAVLGCYPASACQLFALFPEEDVGILTLSDIPSQIYAIPPGEGGEVAQVSFIVAIKDGAGQTQRVFLGRTDLGINPLTQPLIQSLRDMAQMRGSGILLDDNGMILYHPDATRVGTAYIGQRGDQPLFYDETAILIHSLFLLFPSYTILG
jgi:hypothetical protein